MSSLATHHPRACRPPPPRPLFTVIRARTHATPPLHQARFTHCSFYRQYFTPYKKVLDDYDTLGPTRYEYNNSWNVDTLFLTAATSPAAYWILACFDSQRHAGLSN